MQTRGGLHYRRTGQGPPLLVLHSFVGGSGAYGPIVNFFWRDHDVIAVDLPGFAQSNAAQVPPEFPGFADAVIGVADELGLKRFALIGHSMGGNIALQLALDHGERIERAVLYGSVCCGELPNRFETFPETYARIARDGIEATRARLVAAWFKAGEADPNYETCRQAGAGVTAETAIAVLQATSRWDVRGRLAEINVPVLLIGGDRDGAVAPDDLIVQWKGIPGSRLAIVAGCGHAVHYERPEIFLAIVNDFLSGRS